MRMLGLQLRQQEYYRLVTLCRFAEMIRTTTNIAEQGLKELRHSKPTRGSNVTPYVTMQKHQC